MNPTPQQPPRLPPAEAGYRDESRPNIFTFTNYREFVRAVFQHKKASNRNFSHRLFARKAGYVSSAFSKLVMDGKRNLTREATTKFSRAMDLSSKETAFFRLLVQFNQAKDVEERQQAASEIVRSKLFQELNPLSQSRFEYFSRWYYVVIRELIALEGFREDPVWLARVLKPEITPEQASFALQLLQELDLVARDRHGRLRQTNANVTTGDEFTNAAAANYHRQMIQMARDSIDRIEGKHRQISAVTIALSSEGEKHIRDMIQEFRKDLLAAASRFADPTKIVQVNFQVFPMTDEVTKCDA